MKVLSYSDSPLTSFVKNSIFTAGGTPRSPSVQSWRPEALRILKEIGFQGTVCVPESLEGFFNDYTFYVEWETECLINCEKILFWVPRNMQTLPCLTTNMELGYWLAKDPDKVWYGRPNDAVHIAYLDWWYQRVSQKSIYDSLENLLKDAIK